MQSVLALGINEPIVFMQTLNSSFREVPAYKAKSSPFKE